MKRLAALCLALPLLLCLTPTTARAQQTALPVAIAPDQSPLVPADQWEYNAVKTLQDAKIVIGYPDGTNGNREMTRYKFGVAVARLLPLLAPPAIDAAPSKDLASMRQDLRAKLQENPPARDALMRLVDEFQPELTALGQDVPAVQARLAAFSLHAVSPPFPDVPKDHWAFQAVETLRKAGIVTGEADGRFHG